MANFQLFFQSGWSKDLSAPLYMFLFVYLITFETSEELLQSICQKSIIKTIFDRIDIQKSYLKKAHLIMLNRLLIYIDFLSLCVNTTDCTATLPYSFNWTRMNHVSDNTKTCNPPVFPWKRQHFEGTGKSQAKYLIFVSRKAVPFKLPQYNILQWRRVEAN
jgi:hypothetical protein